MSPTELSAINRGGGMAKNKEFKNPSKLDIKVCRHSEEKNIEKYLSRSGIGV